MATLNPKNAYYVSPEMHEYMAYPPKYDEPEVSVIEKKRRIVFSIGRDLNIFDVTEINLDGSWWRIYAGGKFYLINPDKVNYVEIK